MAPDANLYFVNLLIVSVVFLPLHWFLRSAGARQVLSIVLGMYMVLIVGPRFLVFWLPFWIALWGFARLVAKLPEGRPKSYAFLSGLILALMPLVLWKLYPFTFVNEVNRALRDVVSNWVPFLVPADRAVEIMAPLGLSFTTFRALDLLILAYLDALPRLKLREALFYGFFPPVLVVGPIIQIDEITGKTGSQPPEPISESIREGAIRILIGLVKIFVIALPLADSDAAIHDYASTSTLLLWREMLLYAWFLYLNFAGFSDLAIGCARLYGYRIRENFNYPYFRRNVQEFWANWHMSLTGFAQRNVFVPLGGFRKNRQYGAIMATMMVIALWHGLNWSLVLFGVIHGSAMVFLRMRSQRPGAQPSEHPAVRAIATLATFLFVAVTIPMLLLGPADLPGFYARLFGM